MTRGKRALQGLDDDIRDHIEHEVQTFMAQGLSPEEARRQAMLKFGNVALIQEDTRRVWTWLWLEHLAHDARFALRMLRREPGFAAVALSVLATVIGLNTSVFTITAGLLFRPWAGVTDPSRVVLMYPADSRGNTTGFSLAEYRFLADHTRSLAGTAAMRPESVQLGSDGALGTSSALLVSGNFFDVLGIVLPHGRGFRPDEDRAGAPQAVAVLGFDFWEVRFGGDVSIIGTSLQINDMAYTIVGIAPRAFVGPGRANLFLPVAAVSLLHPNDPTISSLLYEPDYCCSDVLGRLAPGTTREQARAELEALSRSFRTEAAIDLRSILVTGTEFLARPGRKNQLLVSLAFVSVALVLVWMLACANIGNLFIARAAARAREISIRLALGASRPRVVRQLLTEGFVLSLAASGLGVVIAYVLPTVILRFVADAGSPPFSLSPDGVVLGYAVLMAAASSIAFGLAPALHATRGRMSIASTAREGLGSSAGRLRSVLLAVQVAVSVILLVSAGLLVRGVQRAGSFDPGFAVNDVSVVSFDLPATYDDARSTALFADLASALDEFPVATVGLAGREPLARSRDIAFVRLHGTTDATPTPYLKVSPGYFDVLGIRIVAGRNFQSAETGGSALINESMARRYWPNESPIGKTVVIQGDRQSPSREIVGVVRDAHTLRLDAVEPLLYQPITGDPRVPKVLVRTSRAAGVARIISRLDPRARVQTTPLSAILNSELDSSRVGARLVGALGAFALALAAVGMFGVFAYNVRQRTREIGIRIALGAQPGAVVRLVLSGQSRALLVGLSVGVLGVVAASVILRSYLYGLSPADPVTYLAVAAALTFAAFVAGYVPARRATSIDAATTLRSE
jgi:predicted permease